MLKEYKSLLKLGETSSKLVEELYNNLSKIIGEKNITTGNILPLVINLMKMVETYPNLSGEEKKNLVTQVLIIFARKNIKGETQTEIIRFIDLFLPSVINSIISVDKNEIIINAKKSVSKCFPCLKTKKSKKEK